MALFTVVYDVQSDQELLAQLVKMAEENILYSRREDLGLWKVWRGVWVWILSSVYRYEAVAVSLL